MRYTVSVARNAVLLAFALTWLAFAARSNSVFADSVVGSGTAASCTESAFDTALSAGGTITFNCGTSPVTITFTFYKQVATDATIDGGNLITLSGGNFVSLFQVFSGKTMTLKNITLTLGKGSFGAIQNFGTLNTLNTHITNSAATDSGGGIDNSGSAQLTNTTLESNSATNKGGGIYNNAGTLAMNASTVMSGTATTGGAVHNSGVLSTTLSTLSSNGASQSGGGIFNENGGIIAATQTAVTGNTASTQYGGGISNAGTITMTSSSVNSNHAIGGGGRGGGIYNDVNATATLTNTTVGSNTSGGIGGGVWSYAVLSLTNSSVISNTSTAEAGGIGSTGTLILLNSTVSGNSGGSLGGGIENYTGLAMLTNVTVYGNSATHGGGILQYSTNATNVFSLSNSIIANSLSGPNCEVFTGSVGQIRSNGYNLSSDGTCAAYFNQTGDQNSVNPNLGSLTNNGGPTLTHMPQQPSPAIDAIPKGTNGCGTTVTTDQRGAARAVNNKCTIGSVEFSAVIPRLWLPMVIR